MGNWYNGHVTSYIESCDGKHKHEVTYDDGDVKLHFLAEKFWESIEQTKS